MWFRNLILLLMQGDRDWKDWQSGIGEATLVTKSLYCLYRVPFMI